MGDVMAQVLGYADFVGVGCQLFGVRLGVRATDPRILWLSVCVASMLPLWAIRLTKNWPIPIRVIGYSVLLMYLILFMTTAAIAGAWYELTTGSWRDTQAIATFDVGPDERVVLRRCEGRVVSVDPVFELR